MPHPERGLMHVFAMLRAVFANPFLAAELWRHLNHVAMRLLRLELDGRKVGNALAQQDFRGADLRHRQFDLAVKVILQPIDKLTGADFFPDIIGMEEHLSFGHLFSLSVRLYNGLPS